MSQRRSVTALPSVSNRTGDINECVRYILYREGSKLPILPADIRKHLMTTCDTPGNEIRGVILDAENILKKVYGYRLVKDDSKGGYMVVLEEPCDSLPSLLVEKKEQALLNIALTHIFMSGGSVTDENLWKFLIQANMMDESDGTIRQLFTKKFTSQLYISSTKSGNGELAKTTFQWGSRASKETSKIFMLQKVAEALGKTPDYWCEQYKDATSNASSA